MRGVILSGSVVDAIRAHAESGYPCEVVGVLAGDRKRWEVRVTRRLSNERLDAAHNRYGVSGKALLDMERGLIAEGLEVVGYYHSHPDHPALYSETDRVNALPNTSYVIASVIGGKMTDLRAFRLSDDRSRMDPETIDLKDE